MDLGNRSQPLPIYFAAEIDGDLTYKSMPGSEIRRIEADQTMRDAGLEFTFFKTFHEAYCLGMIIRSGDRKIVYTADTYFHESLIPHCADADVLIVETSFYKSIKDARKYGHMNSAEAGRLAKEAGVKKAILTHLPHFGIVDRLASEVGEVFNGEIETAFCGMRIEI
jgi:ribonuclease BN (tRNA processing enzyme)